MDYPISENELRKKTPPVLISVIVEFLAERCA